MACAKRAWPVSRTQTRALSRTTPQQLHAVCMLANGRGNFEGSSMNSRRDQEHYFMSNLAANKSSCRCCQKIVLDPIKLKILAESKQEKLRMAREPDNCKHRRATAPNAPSLLAYKLPHASAWRTHADPTPAYIELSASAHLRFHAYNKASAFALSAFMTSDVQHWLRDSALVSISSASRRSVLHTAAKSRIPALVTPLTRASLELFMVRKVQGKT